jgi:hypothetical protein
VIGVDRKHSSGMSHRRCGGDGLVWWEAGKGISGTFEIGCVSWAWRF